MMHSLFKLVLLQFIVNRVYNIFQTSLTKGSMQIVLDKMGIKIHESMLWAPYYSYM